MLPRVTITPDLSGRTLHSAKHFSKPASDHNRSSRKPLRATFVPSSSTRQSATKVLTNATPTRRSFEKPPLEPGAAAPGIQSCLLDADSAGSSPDVQQQGLSDATISQHSSSSTATSASSATSLHKSDSELALLLTGADLSRPGTTTINIGSIPIQVPLAYIDLPSTAEQEQQQHSCPASASVAAECTADGAEPAAQPLSKLKATSAEFYPPSHLAAAAAAAAALASAAVASGSSAGSSAGSGGGSDGLPGSPSAATSGADEAQQLQSESFSKQQHEVQLQHWQAAGSSQQQQDMQPQQWQQDQWHQWHQQQQQAMAMPVPMFFPVPVPVPPYLMPAYPFAFHQAMHQQQHMQVHPIMLHHHHHQQQASSAAATNDGTPATPAPVGSSYTTPSPDPSLQADTISHVSAPTAAAGWAVAHSSSLYTNSSRPSSSASSVASGYTGSRSRQQQQHQALRDAGTVTVSALSCVKDAAGALAKVVSRHGSCLLLSLCRSGDQAALATHVAAKSLAVARFYVNARMAAAGAAGVDAAAVLTGLEPQTPTAAAAAADDEVVFIPYLRHGSSCRAAAATEADAGLGFIVAKANAKDLPVVLPPPVGIPACMQDKQQQHDGSGSSSTVAAASTSAAADSPPPLLKAGAHTDVNKLSNAIIHNILGGNHVALQLAGAAACHVAMKALIKARVRLQRKFHADIVATASFANEDTSGSIGRSTVFLRLDVMRSNLLQQLSAVGSAVAAAIEGLRQQQLVSRLHLPCKSSVQIACEG